ncbi:MAG: hypothetical protein U9N31_06795 [Candidatus Marinimicrobia bacterium]|nr:hypothetical protein [Candidatus Neomarinimicrobiota bacterium]
MVLRPHVDTMGAACNTAYGGLYYRGRRLSELAGWGKGNQSRAFASVVRRAIANGDHQGNDRNIGVDPGSGDPSHACKLIYFRLCQRKQSEYNIKGLGAIVSVIFFT